MKNRDLIQTVLSADGDFSSDWLASAGGKVVVPLPVHAGLSRPTALRVVAGAREAGAMAVLAASLAPERRDIQVTEAPLSTDELLALASRMQEGSELLLAADNLHGALLPKAGYALLAGTAQFMRGALSEGPDKAKADFGRYARTTRSEQPHIVGVAADFPPLTRAWKSPADIPVDSHTGRQLTLMRALLEDAVDGPAYARQWLAERRNAMEAGERVSDAIAGALDEVFYALEDYTIDPSLRDDDDLTDGELRQHVANALRRLRALN
ncbi:colicin immunity domain-containing protein [Streptomyces sp. NPDC001220]